MGRHGGSNFVRCRHARWDRNELGIGFYSGLGGYASGPYPSPLPGVAPFNPDLLFIVAGLNDKLQGRDNATILAGIIALWQRGLAGGSRVFGATLPMASTADSSWLELNKSIVAAAKDYGIVMGIPFYEVMYDPTFAGIQNRAGYTQDQGTARLHPNNVASWWVANKALPIVSPYVTPYDPLPIAQYDYVGNYAASNQIALNPLLTGTVAASGQTGVSGNWCTGGFCNAASDPSNTTRVFSVAAQSGGYGQRVSMAITTVGAETNADFQVADMKANVVPGASYQIVAALSLTKANGNPLDGSENCLGVELTGRFAYAGSKNLWVRGLSAAATNGTIINTNEIRTGLLTVKSLIFTPDQSWGAATLARIGMAVQMSGAGSVIAGMERAVCRRVA